jgi:hypothetical protein
MIEEQTTQDLLAERRSNVLESMRATDAITRETIAGHVAVIDAELARRRAEESKP